MNSANPELDRLRDDLATLRHATAVDVPFGTELVYFWAAVAAACGLLTFTLAMGPGAPIEPVVLGLWIAGAGLLLAAIVRFARVVARRAEQPAPWRELRDVALAKLIGGPLMLGFLVWLYAVGAPLKIVLSVLVFCMSLVTAMYALTRWTRKWAFGIALPGIALGFALPVVPAATVPLAVSACGTAIGVLSALIHLRQLAAARPGR
jgi:hypothetical protein